MSMYVHNIQLRDHKYKNNVCGGGGGETVFKILMP